VEEVRPVHEEAGDAGEWIGNERHLVMVRRGRRNAADLNARRGPERTPPTEARPRTRYPWA
jgi:hypothetical protein